MQKAPRWASTSNGRLTEPWMEFDMSWAAIGSRLGLSVPTQTPNSMTFLQGVATWET